MYLYSIDYSGFNKRGWLNKDGSNWCSTLWLNWCFMNPIPRRTEMIRVLHKEITILDSSLHFLHLQKQYSVNIARKMQQWAPFLFNACQLEVFTFTTAFTLIVPEKGPPIFFLIIGFFFKSQEISNCSKIIQICSLFFLEVMVLIQKHSSQNYICTRTD